MARCKSQSEFRIEMQSEALAVRGALREIMSVLDPLDLDSKEASTVELVLAEVLNNIVEHAYPREAKNAPIVVTCWPAATELTFEIVDFGCEMPNGHVPPGQPPNTDVDMRDLPEGSFGWFLIKGLAKDVVYRRENAANHLSIRFAIATRSKQM